MDRRAGAAASRTPMSSAAAAAGTACGWTMRSTNCSARAWRPAVWSMVTPLRKRRSMAKSRSEVAASRYTIWWLRHPL